ncbi:cytochrome c [Echinicola strongylocentroti]|uniref:Cytochrome c n=1 Tax=Echinicola strongylocentroti TaxID=1795355 RepID=A0A2Z4ILU7_9BACT|nr:cytochrome c [Echinicola strongylocentroti]AWW31536.1 cytochrome c [Echinicola strongylocentroti]
MKILKSIYLVALSAASLGVVSCGASGDDQGLEYAPQMYHSVAYEPLTQIQNEEAGSWLSNREDEKGEFYNSNIYNPHSMNMREPAPNTVARNKYDMLPYRLGVADLAASDSIANPVELNDQVLAAGEQLFMQYCLPCHGAGGEGDGKVGEVIGGVANLKGGAYINLTEGHIFHVITHGKGRMGAHASQISPERRWKIVHYVKQEIQKQ